MMISSKGSEAEAVSLVKHRLRAKLAFAGVGAAVLLMAATEGLAQSGRGWHGRVPDAVARLRPLEDLPATTNLHLAIGLPLRNKVALTNLIRDLYDPSSPKFHQYLTTEQFTGQYGPTPEDHRKVVDFLQARGLKVTGTYSNRMVVDVTGAARDVETAFHIRLRVYQHPTEERTFYSPDAAPWIDADVPVVDVMGLDNYIVPRPLDMQRKKTTQREGTGVIAYAEEGSGPGGLYIGNDFRTAYVPGVTNTGAGQYIALVEFGPYYTNDIYVYETNAHLSTNIAVTNILLDGVTFPPAAGTDAGEQALDIEMCISMAPGATVMYYGGEVVDDIYGKIASDNLGKQISCSFGFGIDSTTEQLYQEFVVQGQNFFVASGDAGAYVGTINPPAGEPYITIVGGTALYTVSPGGAWQSETTWVGSGGGVSTFYAIPNWQQGINMAPLQGSSTMRNFPDVAMMADTVIFIAANNGTGGVGGTSCSSPLWAGFYALANQQAATLGQSPIGFFNPALYAIGKSANYTKCFHDITTGNTTNYSSGPNKFFAATGYDLCTGWGSPAGSNLINALTGVGTNNFMLYATPATLTLVAGGSATVLLTEQPMNKFSGAVSLSASGLPTGVTASFNPASTTGNSILTLAAGSTAAAGTSTVTLTGVSGSVTQTTALTLVIVAATPGTSQANLSSAFTLAAIYTDGSTFSGGADGGGNAYSANLLGSTLSWNGCLFSLGSANASDVVKCVGQTITLPSGEFTSLQMLAAAVDGTQAGQSFVVTYTDGSTSVFTRSLSDWTSPQNYPGEAVVAATAYRDTGGGTADTVTRVFVYGYSFSLNNNKMVRSIKLPNNGDVLVFAITLANDFTFYGSPLSYVLTAGGKAACYLTTGPVNGFSGNVSLSAAGLPAGVTASFNPSASSTTSILTLTANATAAPSNATVYVTGTLSGVTHNMTLNLAVITPIPGATSISLSSLYNLPGIVTDGATFSASGGLDGAGNAYSSTLLTSAPNWDGCLFSLGPANGSDAVISAGQTIALPAGQYTGLLLLAAAINSSQPSQVFQIAYTDGTTATVTQSLSAWTASQSYAGEAVAVAAAYSDTSGGTENPGTPVNVYGYVLGLNDSKTVQSVTLPNNPNVIVLAMTLANVSAPVSLTSTFNRIGIYTDGTIFSAGADGGAYAYSSNLLGSSQVWDSVQFKFGPANANDMVKCAAQTISLPANRYTTLLMLATGVNGSQASQPFTVTYTDGSTASIVQSFSDWANVTAYSNQFVAVTMPYRDLSGGGQSASTAHVFGYLFPLNNTKTVQSLKLPNNGSVDVLAVTLANTPLPVSLQSNYNRAGMYTDGTDFTTGGLDADGNAFSATLLGPSQTWHNMLFNFGLANATNAVSAAGQTITLPQGQYSTLLMLAAAVNGSQSGTFTVNYTNGTGVSFTPSMSDWASSQGFSGETVVVAMSYRDNSGGSLVGPAVDLYGYSVTLNSNNVVQSIKLPSDGNIEVLAITLSNYTAALPEPPAITVQPQGLTVTNGNPASFSVTATGSPALHYQWRTNGVNLSNGGSVAGATTNTLTLSTTTTNNAASYTVVITNAYGAITSAVATLVVGVPPSITTEPLPLTVTNGNPASFSVAASGTAPLAYQWQMNGTNMTDGGNVSGSTNSTLMLSAAGMGNAGSYDVVVTNSYGSITSSVVALNVVAIFIAQQPAPANQFLQAGGSVTWTTVAGGIGPIYYQWYQNSANNPILGATNGSYTLVNAQTSASYFCVASNSYNSVASSTVSATVISPTNNSLYANTILADNPIAFLRLDEHPDNGAGNDGTIAYDTVGGHNGYYTNVVLASSVPNYSAHDSDDYIADFGQMVDNTLSTPAVEDNYVAAINGINFATPTNTATNFSVEAWVYVQGNGINGAGIVAMGAGGGGEQFVLDTGGGNPGTNAFDFYFRDAAGGSVNVVSSVAPALDTWYHVVAVLDEVDSVESLYTNGVLAAETNYAFSSPPGVMAVTNPVTIGARQSADTVFDLQLDGAVADVAIYPYALTGTQVLNHYLASGIAPVFTVAPSNTTVLLGGSATFYSGAFGTAPLAYQWQMNGTNMTDGGNVSGSTNSALTLSAAVTGNAGSYDVVVTNLYGSVTSSVVTLNVVFVFQSAAQGNGAINFNWPTTRGVSYQVQYSTDLSASNWVNLGAPIVATNGVTGASDFLGPDPQRFYRVIQQ